MSGEDLDILVGKITKKILIILLPTVLLSIGAIMLKDHFTLKSKASKEFVNTSYSALYVLLSEYSTKLDEYITSTDKEKDMIWEELRYIRGRIDDAIDDIYPKDIKRGPYGNDYSPL